MAKFQEMSRAVWVRQQILLNPEITLEQLQAAFDKTKLPKSERPKTEAILHQGRSQLKKRWELGSLDEIPRKPNGEVIIRKLVWMYFEMFGYEETTLEHVQNYLALDGIEVKDGNYRNARAAYNNRSVEDLPSIEASDEPRAGKPGKRKYTRRKKTKRGKREVTTVDQYEKIEQQLDKLLAQATELKDGKLATHIRQARRRAGAVIVSQE